MFNYDGMVTNVLTSTLGIQPGDDVIVETWDHGLPIADAFIYKLRELGARPMLLFEHEETFWKSAEKLPEEKLGKVGEHEWAAVEKATGYVFITGPADFLKMWKNRSKFVAATSYNEEWYERAKRSRLRGARIALGYATRQRAHAYKIPLASWQRMLVAASSVDFPELKGKVARFASLMRNGEVRITAPNGTNLALRLAGRDAFQDDCIVDSEDLDHGRNVANIPGGSVLACPDETYAEGSVVFDRPTSFMGKWVGGVRLDFKNGLLSNYRGRLNANLLKTAYDKASGERDRIAAIGVGVNPQVKTGFLQDSLASGVVTLGIGGNDDIGGASKTDFYFAGVITKATLTIDGNAVVRNGKLTL